MKAKFLLFLTLGWMLCAQNIYAQWGGSPCCVPCCCDWSGIYVGINGGVSFGHNKYRFDPIGTGQGVFAPEFTSSTINQKPREGVLGVHFGFNKQCSCFVFGFESFLDGVWFAETSQNKFFIFGPFLGLTPQTTYQTDLELITTITPRIGFTSGCWLFYLKGGFSAAYVKSALRTSLRFRNNVLAADGQAPEFNRRHYHVGWTAGGGIEYMCGCHWIVGLEYDYHKFDRENYGGATAQDILFPILYSLRPSRSTVLLRLSYKI